LKTSGLNCSSHSFSSSSCFDLVIRIFLFPY